MTREKLQELIAKEIPGWILPEEDLVFYEKGTFTCLIRNGNKERCIVVRDGKIIER